MLQHLLSHFCPHWALEVSRALFYLFIFFPQGSVLTEKQPLGEQIFPQETFYPPGRWRIPTPMMRFDMHAHFTVVTKIEILNTAVTPFG